MSIRMIRNQISERPGFEARTDRKAP